MFKAIYFILCIFTFLSFYVSIGWSVSSEEIKHLRQKGYTNEQIREYINSNINQSSSLKIERAENLNYLKDKITFMKMSDRKDKTWRLRTKKITVNFNQISQETKSFHRVYTSNEYFLRINVPFCSIKKMKIQPFTITDSDLDGILSYLSNTKRTAYYIELTSRKLKKIELYIKPPYSYDRHELKRVMEAINSLTNSSSIKTNGEFEITSLERD